MYYTKGQILNLLDCGEKSFKDFISAFQIKNHLINDELVYLKNDIDNALLNVRKTHESYAQHYYTIKQCKSMGISSFSITHKLKRIEIPKEYRFFEFKRLEFLFDKNQDHFFVKDKLIRFKEAIKMLPFTESHGWKNLRKIFNEHNYIIDYTLDKNNGHLLIDDVLKLRELIIERYHFNKLNFLTLQQCRNLGLKKFDMKSLNKKKPDPIDLVYEFKSVLMLYEKKCVEEFLDKKSLLKSNELICEKDISIELGFRSLSKFREIINEYGITHLPRENSYEKKLYRKAEFKYLKDIIQKRYQNNRNNYYNAKDLKKLWIYVKFLDTFCLSFSLGQHPGWIVPHPK